MRRRTRESTRTSEADLKALRFTVIAEQGERGSAV